jgi:hypothetical protein
MRKKHLFLKSIIPITPHIPFIILIPPGSLPCPTTTTTTTTTTTLNHHGIRTRLIYPSILEIWKGVAPPVLILGFGVGTRGF